MGYIMYVEPTAVTIRELKARVSEILRDLEKSPGKEIVITRHGKPCAKLVSLKGKSQGIPRSERKSLRNALPHLHELTDADFAEAKGIWEPQFHVGA